MDDIFVDMFFKPRYEKCNCSINQESLKEHFDKYWSDCANELQKREIEVLSKQLEELQKSDKLSETKQELEIYKRAILLLAGDYFVSMSGDLPTDEQIEEEVNYYLQKARDTL